VTKWVNANSESCSEPVNSYEIFPDYVVAYDERVPFSGDQLSAHRQTIALRRDAPDVRAAVENPRFVSSLHRTLKKWGIGARGSKLVSLDEFGEALTTAVPVLELLEPLRIDGPELPSDLADQLWQVIASLGVVDNDAKLVAGTKTLHHLLPDLVVPIDREWTGKFFQLHNPEWQSGNQRPTFRRVYPYYVAIAQTVQPEQYVTGQGWRTSRTKILDNAIIGFCKIELGF
jgi:hypothetical protein